MSADEPSGGSDGDRAWVNFLSGLAHDLRAPLGVLTEAVSELTAGPEPTDDQRLVAALATKGLGRLNRLADRITLVARLEAGTLDLAQSPLELTALTRQAVEEAAAIDGRREVSVSFQLPSAPVRFTGDEKRLGRAISEVASNAFRHARRNVTVIVTVEPGEARVVVEDDGRGVAEDKRASLFQRFVPHKGRSGTGIGLSLAHDLIQRQGGRIELVAGSSTTRFLVTLPMAKPAS